MRTHDKDKFLEIYGNDEDVDDLGGQSAKEMFDALDEYNKGVAERNAMRAANKAKSKINDELK